MVELNESPILGVTFSACISGDRRGVSDVTKDMLVLFAPVLRDVVVELVDGFDRLPPLLQRALNPRPHLRAFIPELVNLLL